MTKRQFSREQIKNFVLFSLTLLLCLIGAELFLRNFFPINSLIYDLDPKLLHKLRPNSRKLFVHDKKNGGEKVLVRINEQGFRGPSLQNPKNGKRIVVYGDSFIEGETTKLEKTFVMQVQNRLQDQIKQKIEVINAGVVGYGPDQSLLKMESGIDVLKPDLIIFSVFSDNDFGDLLRNKLFRLGPNQKLLSNTFSISSSLKSKFQTATWSDDKLMIHKAFKILKKDIHYFLMPPTPTKPEKEAEYIQRTLDQSLNEYSQYVEQNNNEVQNLLEDHYDSDISIHPESKSANYKVKLMEKVIEKATAITDHYNIPLILLIIPSPIDVCDAYDWEVDISVFPEYKRSTLTDTLVQIATQNDISSLNLFDTFRKVDANTLYYHHGDNHWNDAGQELAAKAMVRLILSKRYF